MLTADLKKIEELTQKMVYSWASQLDLDIFQLFSDLLKYLFFN